jgi:hypothetical protein
VELLLDGDGRVQEAAAEALVTHLPQEAQYYTT